MIGAYGVIHQSVAARTPEIGIRMALGASAASVLRMVLTSGMTPGRRGTRAGAARVVALSRIVATFLYETSALDPLIYTVVTLLLLASRRSRAWRPRCAPRVSIRCARCGMSEVFSLEPGA